MNGHTLRQALRALIVVLYAGMSSLPAVAQSSPEGFAGGSRTSTTTSCDSCCSISNFNCSNSAVKIYINDNLDSCLVCTDKLEARARGCGMIPSDECPVCPTPATCPACPNPGTPGTCPTPVVCASGTQPACPTPVVCTNSCPIKGCPPGESLWNPDSPACECVKDPCTKIGDLTKIAIHRYHPNSEPNSDFMASFADGQGKELLNSTSLNEASPCMESARSTCSANLVGSQFGFYSYRLPDRRRIEISAADGIEYTKAYNEYVAKARAAGNDPASPAEFAAGFRSAIKYMDTCIASSLQIRYGIGALTAQARTVINGVLGEHLQGTALLYKDCRPVEPWKQQLLSEAKCSVAISASFNEFTSPVSLLWSSDVKIREVASRSKFPLNPKDAGKWFVWRGSGLTPLVVWDPDKSGMILGAAQLFGTHTWGKEWKHGYEPLTTLDKNANGWLEGDELKDLSLWFDFNQDGISDRGEVKQLSDVGVTALGVKVTATDKKSGEVHAAQGFRRTVNGTVVEGASVDWFSGTEDGRFGMEALEESPVEMAKNIDQATMSTAFDPLDAVSGLWDWRVVDQASGELPENMPHGTLVLYSTNKKIEGTVYVMDQFAPNRSGIGERVSYQSISGAAEAGAKGQPRVTFSSQNQAGGSVESVAQLSEDGMYLAGITTEQQERGKAPVKYAWVARRAPIGK